jgi:hypothetical protein
MAKKSSISGALSKAASYIEGGDEDDSNGGSDGGDGGRAYDAEVSKPT